MRPRRIAWLVAACVACIASACSHTTPLLRALAPLGCELSETCNAAAPVVVPAYRLGTATWHPGRLVAGAARVDITPPVGFPTGGHGPAGGFARAYWTRLHARAFFFADADGRPLILVSCDLFAVPGGLAAAVSRAVAERWADSGLVVPPEAVVIAATHTHQGPGNFLTAAIYNQFAATYQGFDAALFDFLVGRVTLAVDSAIADARHGGAATLVRQSARLPDTLLLNRSPETFLANWNAQALLDRLEPREVKCAPTIERGEALATGWTLPGCPRRRAADPTATVLSVERAGRRVASLVFVAVHPTVLDHGAPLYSSDFLGQAVSTMERRGGEIVGVFNGAEGDVVPSRGARDMREVRRVADAMTTALDAVRAAPRDTIVVASIDARRALLVPGADYGGALRLPADAVVGVPALGGAEDDRQVLHALGWHEGVIRVPREGQGLKQPALDADLVPLRLTPLFAPRWKFPAELPVTLARLGTLRIAAVPLEMSTALGLALRDSLGGGPLELVGLANEYASYTATADEYARQDYMGASTLWGAGEGGALIAALRCLTGAPMVDCARLVRADPTVVPARTYRPGKKPDASAGANRVGASWVGDSLPAPDDGFADVLRDVRGAPARALPYFEWTETVAVRDEFDAAAARRVEILEQRGDGWVVRTTPRGTPDDDGDAGVLTVLRQGRTASADAGDAHRWAAIWLAPALEDALPAGTYKFRVTVQHAGTTVVHESCPFRVRWPAARREQARTNCA
ncbi:neutral/alkaline non-lysosomal ceramidase N-terminal domain-containing protein [Gemmatirosa kalamazoonensis]|uniref:neutral/alkaline non-lysosomal ceramidase N-terminal domain-containing protein n=1 Tax=Gemmatirosa kalamazoonensis TaxID=861299 RepID=UPI00130E5257|nr:neutral/alkaline non-lysosomal ceramidase N-terminal domain-containing protein [Gemmatirosa kalamazoonensis]